MSASFLSNMQGGFWSASAVFDDEEFAFVSNDDGQWLQVSRDHPAVAKWPACARHVTAGPLRRSDHVAT